MGGAQYLSLGSWYFRMSPGLLFGDDVTPLLTKRLPGATRDFTPRLSSCAVALLPARLDLPVTIPSGWMALAISWLMSVFGMCQGDLCLSDPSRGAPLRCCMPNFLLFLLSRTAAVISCKSMRSFSAGS